MALIVVFDIPTGRVTEVHPSANTPDFEERADVLINPELDAVETVPREHWQVDGGLVREMTVQEKADLAAEAATATIAQRQQAIQEVRTNEPIALVLDALLRTLHAEDNAIRIALVQPTRTIAQYRAAFVAQLDSIIEGLS